MILPLRQLHRRVFVALAVVLPLAFAAGIAARRTIPDVVSLPPELSSQSFTAIDSERSDLFSRAPVRVQLYREQETERLAVRFTAAQDFLKPDLIVYWSAGQSTTSDTLPPGARLLGAFVAGPLLLPAEASDAEGCLILFSLAAQEVIDVSKPVRFSDSRQEN